jgi:hypothetical protein
MQGCPSNCPSKTRRIARISAVKTSQYRRELNNLGVDFQFRNQQAVGSSPTGGSNLFRCNDFRMIGNLSEAKTRISRSRGCSPSARPSS